MPFFHNLCFPADPPVGIVANDFDSEDYSWVGSAYSLTSTALIPWSASHLFVRSILRRAPAHLIFFGSSAGGLAQIFGRRPMMLIGLSIFALGSALVGAGQSMAMVIGGRSVQGVGGGAILTMVCRPFLDSCSFASAALR